MDLFLTVGMIIIFFVKASAKKPTSRAIDPFFILPNSKLIADLRFIPGLIFASFIPSKNPAVPITLLKL